MFIQKKNLSIALAALLALGAGPSITESPLFRVSRISVEGLRLLETGEVLALSGVAAGANLYEVDLKDAAARVEAHPMVRSARIVRTPPDGVLIAVVERTPLALINLETLCGIDEEGVLIPFHPTFVDLPVITGVSLKAYTLGHPVSEEGLSRCLALLKEARRSAPDLWNQTSEVRPGPDRIILNLVGDGLEVWMKAEDVPAQAEKFRALEAAAKWPALPGYVDLRFSGQVVVGPPKPGPEDERAKEKVKKKKPLMSEQ
jgi:cell division protein FtsQ